MRRILITCCFVLVVATAAMALFCYQLLLVPVTPEKPVSIAIAPGTSLHKIARELEDSGVIRNALALRLLARWEQRASQVQAGTYRFQSAARPEQILERLIKGDVEKVSLTIPEGFTLQQIIARIAEAGYGRAEVLDQLAHDRNFIHSLQIDADSLEGYLFPETYLFAPGVDERTLLQMMTSQFRAHLDDQLLQQAKDHGLNLHQLVTLASIIEKETAAIEEMPLISSVFHNRLKRGIPLQTDPTVIYGIKNFDGNITRKDLTTPTPYNTYLIRGLPPGPIASPGLDALRAAAAPATTRYLYFVARGDGSHQFSTTLREHNAAVRRYQLHRR